MIAGGAATV